MMLRQWLLVLAILCGTFLLAPRMSGEVIRIALVPPHDYAPTMSRLTGLEQNLGVPVRELSPEELVDPDILNPTRFPIAVYAGGERYCFTVNSAGDGAQALLDYVADGGILLVAGMCWPFYRPVDFRQGEWVRSDGKLPDFEGQDDQELRQHMKRFDQTAVGNLNRFFGLNIAGKGTQQFEKPDESVQLIATNALVPTFQLPPRTPFPSAGDLRFRPVSMFHGLENVTIQPLLQAVGDESGTDYGAAAAVVAHDRGGTVVYIWGTLMDGPLGGPLVDGVLRLAAHKNPLTRQENETLTALREQIVTLRKSIADSRAGVEDRAGALPAGRYLSLTASHVEALCDQADRALMVHNLRAAEGVLSDAQKQLGRLEKNLEGCIDLAERRSRAEQ